MKFLLLINMFLTTFSCSTDLESPTKSSNSYKLEHEGFPNPIIPEDNSLTIDGIALGRKLFYEKLLSSNKSMSCATCHVQENAFTDTNRFSTGVRGLKGARQSMAVFNMAWSDNDFFWDGRAHLLRDQVLMPIQDSLEMNETLVNIVEKLNKVPSYVSEFHKVFETSKIEPLQISLALEQFIHSIVSNKSKYDRFLRGDAQLTASEERGRILFFSNYDPLKPNATFTNCSQCHSGPNFENNNYMNNGLDTDLQMKDEGRAKITKSQYQKGAFKVPSLRNIEITPPYMHDGRFKTLKEVIDHYSEEIKISSTVNPTLLSTSKLSPLLDSQEKVDLITFLKTLTDNELITNVKYSDPFKD